MDDCAADRQLQKIQKSCRHEGWSPCRLYQDLMNPCFDATYWPILLSNFQLLNQNHPPRMVQVVFFKLGHRFVAEDSYPSPERPGAAKVTEANLHARDVSPLPVFEKVEKRSRSMELFGWFFFPIVLFFQYFLNAFNACEFVGDFCVGSMKRVGDCRSNSDTFILFYLFTLYFFQIRFQMSFSFRFSHILNPNLVFVSRI